MNTLPLLPPPPPPMAPNPAVLKTIWTKIVKVMSLLKRTDLDYAHFVSLLRRWGQILEGGSTLDRYYRQPNAITASRAKILHNFTRILFCLSLRCCRRHQLKEQVYSVLVNEELDSYLESCQRAYDKNVTDGYDVDLKAVIDYAVRQLFKALKKLPSE